MQNISQNITYREATYSVTARRLGITNDPESNDLLRMKKIALKVFEPLRAGLGGRPIHIASFYRCPELNTAVGGSDTSQHPTGEAIDLDNDGEESGPTNAEIFYYILENLEFDQLIFEEGNDTEPAWVHVSFDFFGENRGEVLRSRKHKYSQFRTMFGLSGKSYTKITKS